MLRGLSDSSAWCLHCSYDATPLDSGTIQASSTLYSGIPLSENLRYEHESAAANQHLSNLNYGKIPLLSPIEEISHLNLSTFAIWKQRVLTHSFSSITYIDALRGSEIYARFAMGVLETIAGPLAQEISQRSTGTIIAAGVAAFVVLAVVLNVLNQVLFANPNEPPVVFHWLPIIGSTITYGIDPYRFFFDCRAKVRFPSLCSALGD